MNMQPPSDTPNLGVQQPNSPPAPPQKRKYKDATTAKRQKRFRANKKLISQQLAPTAVASLAGLKGEERDKVAAAYMEQGANGHPNLFLYYAIKFLRVGITGTGSVLI